MGTNPDLKRFVVMASCLQTAEGNGKKEGQSNPEAEFDGIDYEGL